MYCPPPNPPPSYLTLTLEELERLHEILQELQPLQPDARKNVFSSYSQEDKNIFEKWLHARIRVIAERNQTIINIGKWSKLRAVSKIMMKILESLMEHVKKVRSMPTLTANSKKIAEIVETEILKRGYKFSLVILWYNKKYNELLQTLPTPYQQKVIKSHKQMYEDYLAQNLHLKFFKDAQNMFENLQMQALRALSAQTNLEA